MMKSEQSHFLSAPEIFSTARLVAERLKAEHLPYLYQLDQDPKTMEFMGGPRTKEFIEENIQFRLRQWENRGYGTWLIREKTTSHFVGTIAIRDDRIDGKLETGLGYTILPEYWGNGLATEIGEEVLKIAAQQLKMNYLIACTHIRNTSSKRVLEKLGFERQHSFIYKDEPHLLYRWICSSLIE